MGEEQRERGSIRQYTYKTLTMGSNNQTPPPPPHPYIHMYVRVSTQIYAFDLGLMGVDETHC